MAIVGGFDIHRRQVTFDYLDTVHRAGAAGPDRSGVPGRRCAAGWRGSLAAAM